MQESLDLSLVRIRTADGRVVGAGFLVSERLILTCAHVISQALGLPDHPFDPPQGVVSLDFPLIPPRTLLNARVVQWCPPQPDGRGDIAGLELQSDPPSAAEVVRFAPTEDLWEHPFRTFGFPAGYDDGVWATGHLLGRQATDWVMIEDIKAQGFAVAPGFSGTPVWDTRLQGVVGMVVAASRPSDLKAAFVLPLDVLVAAWPLIEPVTRQRVFLSAAPADANFAARLTTDLEARDIVVWDEQHTPGEDHADKEERLRQAIRATQAVVLVVSSQTRSSRTVKEHLRLADLYQRRLILVWVGDDEHTQPQHYGWRETIWVDANSTQYTTALDAIEANLSQRRSISDLLGSSGAAPEQEPRNPYKGLRAFTTDDAGDFFGRDRLVDDLVKDIAGTLAAEQPPPDNQRLLTIIGPSGSGKSSIVMAGLLPKLQHGALPGSDVWVYLEPMVPGKRPIEALALTLKSHFPDTSFKTLQEDLEDDATRGLHLLATQLVKQRGSSVVLLVDQFEELFTQTESEDERRRFIDLLLTATTEPRGPLLVLLTLRADFYDRLLQYPELYQFVKAHQRPLFPMEVDDLRATIEQPAVLPDVQLTFEGNLVGDLLFEMQGQVGVLPLLQFTLDQLFQRRSGHRLTLSAYREIGGVKGALSQHAEQTYTVLPSEEHRRLARALFVRLIDPGASEQDTTRRRAALSEFMFDDPTQTHRMRETIDTFIAARLLTTNEVAGTTTLEVSHEAVIREWKRLAEWLREAREDITLQQAISEDATEWIRHGKPTDRLYRGTQLTETQEWAGRNLPSRDEAAFLQAGITERQHQEAAEQSRQARELTLKRQTVNRLRYLVVVLTLFLVGVIVFASVLGVNLQQNLLLRQQDERDKQFALSHALAANADYSLSQNELDRALLLSVKALQTANTYEARSSLLHALEQSPRINTMLRPEIPNAIDTLAFNSNGASLVSSSFSDIDVWDTKAKTYHTLPLVAQTYGIDIISVALSPTDHTMVTAGQAGVWLWDIQTSTLLAQLAGRMINPPARGVESTSTTFSRDGKMVAFSQCMQYSGGTFNTCITSQIVIWNVTSEQRIGSPLVVQGDVSSLALSPDHQVLAYTLATSVQSTSVQLWNVATEQSIGPLAGDRANGVRSVAFSPDGKILVTSDFGNYFGGKTLQLWDVTSRQPIGSPLVGHTDLVSDIAFSPDGKTLASSSRDGTVRLWDVASGQPIGSPLISNPEQQESVAFSPDGKILASGGEGGTITLWNIATDGSPISQRYNYTVGVDSAVFSPDGRTIIVGSDDGRIFLQDSKTGERTDTLDTAIYPPRKLKLQPQEYENLLSIQSLAISRDGHILAAGRDDGTIILWDIKTRKPFMQFTYTNLLRKVVLSADGRMLAASGIGNTFTLWNVAKRTAIHTRSYQFQTGGSLALSPNGRLLAVNVCSRGQYNTGCQLQQIILWDVVTDTLIDRFSSVDVADLAFSPDGNTLAWSRGAGISLWNVTTRKSIGQTLSLTSEKAFDYPEHMVFSADGRMLASYSTYSSSFILWNVTTPEPVTSPIGEGAYLGLLNGVAISPNGQQLVSVGFARSAPVGGSGSSSNSNQGIVTLWNMSLASWENQACSIANRNLTREEWTQFVGSEPFGKVCPDLPLP